MSRYTRGLLAVILAVVLVLPAAAFAMLPEANARSSTGMDGPTVSGKIVDPNTSDNWTYWAAGSDGSGKISTQNVGRIWTDKTVEAGEESDFVTTLSAISSTSNTITTVAKPLDIVMVLDASGSMDNPMGGRGSTKRVDALKTAANSFIDTIATQNESIADASKQHQVAIVKFAGDKSTAVGNNFYRDGWGDTYNYSQIMKNLTPCMGEGAESLKSTVKSISPAGATQADYGLQLAEGISSKRSDAKKVVVFFTDGSPTSSNGFEASVADSAINSAKSLKANGADIYTIGIFSGANPGADPTASGTINENKFMHAVSSNYPAASSSISYWTGWTINFGARAENANYYKSAKNAQELEDIFKDISESITEGVGYPTETHGGYANKSGYITFTDELGDFMQVDDFTEVEYNGTTFKDLEKSTKGNVDTYTFTGEAANLVITVQRAAEGNPQQGDIVEVKIPASLIPLRNFNVDETKGTLTVNDVKPIRVKYASSVKDIARENLFTPDEALKKYIEKNTTGEQSSKSVAFYANKWSGDKDLGDTIANFKPATTNRYYFFQKQTPIYTDPACTQPAKGQLERERLYYYQDEFEMADGSGKLDHGTTVIEFTGGHAAQFVGAVVKDESSGSLSFSEGTARLAFIDELHADKKSNATETASDVLNPRWNDTSSKESATHVDSHLGNNGKISFAYNMTPATVNTKADFGLTKVFEGREWTNEDTFEFGLTSENGAPIPESATAPVTASVTKDDLDDKGKAVIDFGTIKYTEPGTYVYKVSEKNAGTTVDGITYSDNVAEITVTVTPNKAGVLSADVKVTSGKAEFENTYATNPVESSVTDQIDVAKSLGGRDLAAGEFSFELREVKGEDSELIETVENGADGKVTFSAIKYDKIGQHTYTLHEIKGDAGGITYDDTVYTIVTTISDNGKGQLVATHELQDAEKAIFENTYTVTPKSFSVTDQITATKSLTGRALKAGEFHFELVEGDDVVATGTNDAEGNITMSAVKYDKAGKHTYTLREVNGGTASNGITYDGKTYTVVTTITDNGDGTLSATHVLKDVDEAKFVNSYKPGSKDSSVTDQITATKSLDGRDLKAGEFRFELVEGEG